jgi:plastocyanin
VLTRRTLLWLGGGLLAAGLPFTGTAAEAFDIVMRGNSDGSKVWFDPVGLLIPPGASVTWTNRDPGNSHTSTAYHPENDGRPLRIPPGAKPWTSDYLLPDQAFTAIFSAPGVYDYFCLPHELAGMVGRIVVASAGEAVGEPDLPPLPDIAPDAFPSVVDILREGRVSRN